MNSYEKFDEACREEVRGILSLGTGKCLQDRLEDWVVLLGFMSEHFKWFDKPTVKA